MKLKKTLIDNKKRDKEIKNFINKMPKDMINALYKLAVNK